MKSRIFFFPPIVYRFTDSLFTAAIRNSLAFAVQNFYVPQDSYNLFCTVCFPWHSHHSFVLFYHGFPLQAIGFVFGVQIIILLADAKKIALNDAGANLKVVFTTEELIAGGIKSPYYYFVFESDSARWTYKIDAVLGGIMDKTCNKIIPSAPEFIGLEKAKQIALKDAGLDETVQKIVFTREELSRNSGKPCYVLEFRTDKCEYAYKVDAVSGDIIEKNIK